MNEKEAIERVEKYIKSFNGNALDCVAIGTLLNLLEKKDKIIDLMAEDKYENINMIQMANIGKEVNYDPIKLFSGIPDEEAIKIIKQYYERKVENGN